MGLFDGLGTQLPTERMMSCAGNGDVDGLRSALQEGADPNFRRTDMSALLLALSRGHEACALALLEANPNVNMKNNNGWRALHEAVLKNFPTVVDQLIDQGATITARDDHGTNALHVAVTAGSAPMAVRLLEEGAALDAVDHKGVAPLMIAVERRDLAMIDLLIDRGADPLQEDAEHRSSLDRAKGWVDGEARFESMLHARQEAQALLQAAKAQDVGMSTIAKRRRPG